MTKVFVDTDIFIDAYDKNRKLYEESLNVLYHLIENSIDMYTSADIIKTMYYTLEQKDREKAILSIEYVNKFAKIVELSNKEVNKACKLLREDKSYKDLNSTLQYLLAKKEKCKYILTNSRDFYSSDIKVLSAKKFVDEIGG